MGKVKVSDRELEMAFTLIDIFRKPFDPSEYQDHYREALAELIEAKLEGKQVVKAPAARETRILDLADALKRSVEAAKKEASKPKPPARSRTRASRPARQDPEGWMSPAVAESSTVLDQLETREQRLVLSIDGHELQVTNLDKVLWPRVGRSKPITKRDLLRYLTRVSPWLLPHLAGRPMFTTRFPDGVNGKSFYQKHWDRPLRSRAPSPFIPATTTAIANT